MEPSQGLRNMTKSKELWRQIRLEMKQVIQSYSTFLLIPVVISAILLIVFFWRRYLRWTVPCQSSRLLNGKTVIITGASGGLGKSTAYDLAKRGAKVILACRNMKKAEAVARAIRMKTHNDNVYAYYIDLGSLRTVKDFVQDFQKNEPKLDVLINNAAYLGPRATTEDGYERSFGVNYLGHFYLTYLLKDRLKKCAPSRIVNVCSDSYAKGKLEFEDLAMKNYDIYGAYARSKLAIARFTVEAHRCWFPDVVLAYAVHPGCVHTELLRNWPGVFGEVLRAAARFLFKTPEEGCQTIVYCAVAEGIRDQSGKMFENCKPLKTKDFVKDKAKGRQLWNKSLRLCDLDEEPDVSDDEPTPEVNNVKVTGEQDETGAQHLANPEGKKEK
ncbi:retinol dehydrogenase 13-like [Mizuhopecten yessoensis]|uniref:retinol dehydrogenase 13-like n=1 Tax=Mizuhopecten yessoensis TaxID=6573 RepID=UPI000B45A7C3|nr:retinol dehydrogenase 13-like [Mizuhopecten yessoensis]